MSDVLFLHINSKAKEKTPDTPSNFHIDLPSCLHRDSNQDNLKCCFQIVHVNIQGLWNLGSQHLTIRKTLISPAFPSMDTDLTLEGGSYTLDSLISSLNLLAVNIFKIEKYKNSITNQEHLQLINLAEKEVGVYSNVLEMPYTLATILGFTLPQIKHQARPPPKVCFILHGFCKDADAELQHEGAAAPSIPPNTLLNCVRDDSVNITIIPFETFQNAQGQDVIFQGDYLPNVQNNLTELKVSIKGDYLVALPKILRSPNYSFFSPRHTLAYFHPHWNTLLKPAIPGTVTLFPTVHQSTWLQFKSRVLNFILTDISGNEVPVDPRGQIELVIKVTRQIVTDKPQCS